MKKNELILSVRDLNIKFNLRGKILHAIRGIDLDVYHGEVLAMLSLGEDCAARGEAGKALLYYRKARQTAQGMPDIEYTPRICLRLAQAETRYVSAKKAMALAAEDAQGFAILAREKEPDAAELQAEAEQLLRELADPKPRNTAYNIDSLQLD